MKKFLSLFLSVFLLAGLTSVANAAFTAGMTQQAKQDMLNGRYIQAGANASCTASATPYACCTGSGTGTCTPVLKISLGLQSANTTIGPGTTASSSFTDLGTAHGYTTGGLTLTSCTSAATAGSSPLAADLNCTGTIQWTASDSTGITADCAMIYNSTTGTPLGFFTFTSASATGSGATFTITPPTVSTSVRGLLYLQ